MAQPSPSLGVSTPPPSSRSPNGKQMLSMESTRSLRTSPLKDSSPPRMVCVIFVAGHNDLLEKEIAGDASGRFEKLKGVPKALLPSTPPTGPADASGSTILGRWWDLVNTRQQFKEVYLVTNANKFKYYERWATANDFPVENIINDGTTSVASRMGSVADLDLVLRTKRITDNDIMVVAGDMIFSRGFDISGVQRFFREKQGDVAVYYELSPHEQSSSRGIVEVRAEEGAPSSSSSPPPPLATHHASSLVLRSTLAPRW